jgi:hypothetical protein
MTRFIIYYKKDKMPASRTVQTDRQKQVSTPPKKGL